MDMNTIFSAELWYSFFKDFDKFLTGFTFTLLISIGAFTTAILLGVIFSAMATSKNKMLVFFARVYVEFYQNTPLLVQFVLIYYGLPLITQFVIMPSIYWTAVICVGLYHGAYIAEVIRSGIQAVPYGQIEAALSQGFSYVATMKFIVLPQAIRIILPPMANQVVNLIKNTSTVAIIGGVDIMFMTKHWSALNANYIPPFVTAALLYFILCFPLATWARRWEIKNKQTY